MPRITKSDNRIQFVGSEADLQSGPDDMRNDNFPGGMVEFVGSEAELSRKTDPMGVFDKHVRGGTVQFIGSEAECNRTPRRGWQSYTTPISQNSDTPEASVSSYRTTGKRNK